MSWMKDCNLGSFTTTTGKKERKKNSKKAKNMCPNIFCEQKIREIMDEVAPSTPPNSEIICGQNVGKKMVCGMILFFEKKAMVKI